MYWNITDEERFFQALEFATDKRELLRNFLSDVLTEKETEQCIHRLKTACLIHDGATYQQIRSITKLSPSTIALISKKLANKEGGFREIIKNSIQMRKVTLIELISDVPQYLASHTF